MATKPINIVDKIVNHLNRFMVFPDPDQATALALWVLHTWTFSESFPRRPFTTPYLYVNSLEPQCGKTLLIDLLEPLVLNPERAVDMTSAVMFTLIEEVSPTLFIDEVDAIWSGAKNEALRGVLNGGYKSSGYVWRKIGKEPVKFRTFSPKLLAGIDNGMLPDTIATRSIPIHLRRVAKIGENGELIAPDDSTREVYYTFVAEPAAEQLVREIEAFIAEWRADWTDYTPAPIPGLNPRAWEILMPLVQVARRVGIEKEAREILARVVTSRETRDSPGVALLKSIRAAFDETGADKLHTATILNHLGDSWNGKLLSNRLKEFKIESPTTMVIGGKALKGYYRHQFENAWEVHCTT